MQTFSFRTTEGTLITTTDFEFFLQLLKIHFEEKRRRAIKALQKNTNTNNQHKRNYNKQEDKQ